MIDDYRLPPPFTPDPPQLWGSFDPQVDGYYFPPRSLSVDGKLRRLETVPLPDRGTLSSFTRMGPTIYGQVDLSGEVRILATLAPGDYAIGDPCRLEQVPGEGDAPARWRFAHA